MVLVIWQIAFEIVLLVLGQSKDYSSAYGPQLKDVYIYVYKHSTP